jgi:hypothetical protein
MMRSWRHTTPDVASRAPCPPVSAAVAQVLRYGCGWDVRGAQGAIFGGARAARIFQRGGEVRCDRPLSCQKLIQFP